MYTLLRPIKALGPLCEELESHIKKSGLRAIDSMTQDNVSPLLHLRFYCIVSAHPVECKVAAYQSAVCPEVIQPSYVTPDSAVCFRDRSFWHMITGPSPMLQWLYFVDPNHPTIGVISKVSQFSYLFCRFISSLWRLCYLYIADILKWCGKHSTTISSLSRCWIKPVQRLSIIK